MMACVSPAGTRSVRPLMISAPPTSTCRSFTSNTRLLSSISFDCPNAVRVRLRYDDEPTAANNGEHGEDRRAVEHLVAQREVAPNACAQQHHTDKDEAAHPPLPVHRRQT